MSKVLSLILGGGRGSRLFPLTKSRSKPAVPVAGKYRLIDIPISNCINSGISSMYVLTQFLSVSLHNHISQTYKFDMFSRGFVDILAAQQTNETTDWYQGTADAVRQNLRYLSDDYQQILILSGDQLYRMDYRPLIALHREKQADVTIAVLPVAKEQTTGFGIVRVDDTGRVVGFVEKPKTAEALAPFHTPAAWIKSRGINAPGREYLASMGIYLFNRATLVDLLNADPPPPDFGKDVFPKCIREMHVQAHLFDGYWEDLGTIKSYHESNLGLASGTASFDFNSDEGVIYTRMRNLPPSWVDGASVHACLISDGVIVEKGATLDRCSLGVRSRVGKNTTLKDTVMIGSDRLETELDRAFNRERNVPNLNIGDNCVIENAILDKDCRIGHNVKLTNAGRVQEAEADNYVIRDGIIVVPRGAVIQDGTVI